MKKIKDSIKRTPMLLALVLILFCFFPSAIITPSESSVNAIVTAVGLDKNDQGYEVTLMTFLSHPNQSYSEQYEVFSSSAPSISEAFENASLQIGKNISLFHAHTAIVSEKLLEDDIVSSLDYLGRIASLPQSCVLVSTNVTSKQFLEFIQELDKESDINLEDLLFYTSNYVLWKYTTINSFYEGYYSPVKTSILGHLAITEGDINGIPIKNVENVVGFGEQGKSGDKNSTNENSSDKASNNDTDKPQGSTSQASKETEQQPTENSKQIQIINDGSSLLIKNGKTQAHLSKDILRGINWLNSAITGELITLEDVTDEKFENVKLIYKVENQQILERFEFENGIPVYTANLKLFVSLLEANGSKKDMLQSKETAYISEKIRKLVEQKVKNEISTSIDFIATQNCDAVDMYEKFYTSNREQTKKFLQTQDIQPDEFLKNVVFKVIVSLFPV